MRLLNLQLELLPLMQLALRLGLLLAELPD
jgi:hypothetical protein